MFIEGEIKHREKLSLITPMVFVSAIPTKTRLYYRCKWFSMTLI